MSSSSIKQHRSPATASNKSTRASRANLYATSPSSACSRSRASSGSCAVNRRRYCIDSGEHPNAPGSASSFGTRSTNAESGRRTSCDWHPTRTMCTRCSAATRVNSCTSLVFPMPGSPQITYALPLPSLCSRECARELRHLLLASDERRIANRKNVVLIRFGYPSPQQHRRELYLARVLANVLQIVIENRQRLRLAAAERRRFGDSERRLFIERIHRQAQRRELLRSIPIAHAFLRLHARHEQA